MDTGATTLAFAAYALGALNFSGVHVHADTSGQPLDFEIALVTGEMSADHARAVAASVRDIAAAVSRPRRQVVSYLCCPDGVLVVLGSPISA